MSNKWRRFEVLLPLAFNDGRAVPEDWVVEAVMEIVKHFGAASYETQSVEGHWRAGELCTGMICRGLSSMYQILPQIDVG